MAPSNSSEQDSIQSIHSDVSLPIGAPLIIAMPFIHWQEWNMRSVSVDSTQSTYTADRRILAGFLHHPSEGAPEWKLEVGRQGDFQTSGRLVAKASFNLEKPLPFLRPDNSDKLESWLACSTIVGKNDHTFTLPELGWTWRELSSGLVLEFVAPTLVRIGLHQNQWTATIGARQNWIIVNDADADAGFTIQPHRLLLVEAVRDLPRGFNVTFSAGAEVHETSAPYAALGFAWNPRN